MKRTNAGGKNGQVDSYAAYRTMRGLIDLRPELSDERVRQLLASLIGYPTLEKLDKVIERYASNPRWHLLGYKEEDAVIGLIGIEMMDFDEAIIQHISVLPEAQRRGVGRLMIKRLMTSHSLGCVKVETDRETVDFYRRCGFEVQSLGEKYPGIERFQCTLYAKGVIS